MADDDETKGKAAHGHEEQVCTRNRRMAHGVSV
jgi:hypothetical protein